MDKALTIVIFRKDGTSQVVNPGMDIFFDKNKRKLSNDELNHKILSIAKTIVGDDYRNHTWRRN